jgi:hypothetical protein
MHKNCPRVSVYKQWDSDVELSDDDSVDSEGSSITVIESLEETRTMNAPIGRTIAVIPGSPVTNPFASPTASPDLALQDTLTEERSKKRNAPDDCHVLILWSELQNLVSKHMACSKCGMAITKFDHRTIGIATELQYNYVVIEMAICQ